MTVQYAHKFLFSDICKTKIWKIFFIIRYEEGSISSVLSFLFQLLNSITNGITYFNLEDKFPISYPYLNTEQGEIYETDAKCYSLVMQNIYIFLLFLAVHLLELCRKAMINSWGSRARYHAIYLLNLQVLGS